MSYRDDARSSRKGLQGVVIAAADYPGGVWFPGWNKEAYQPTIFRPLGPVNDPQTEFLPWRFTADAQNYGEWIAARRLFRGGTAQRYTFIADMYDPETGEYCDPDAYPNPAYVLYEAWEKGKGSHPEWERLKEPVFRRNKGIEAIKTHALLQGILLAHHGKSYFQKPLYPIILCLTWSAKCSLEEQLDLPVEVCADATDINQRFACGDVLRADGGKLLTFFSSATDPESAVGAAQAANIDYGAGGAGTAEKASRTELAHYVCRITAEPQPLPRTADGKILFAAQGTGWQPWEQTLKRLTAAEMIKLLILAYEDMPDLLIYAFEERGWLPDWFYTRIAPRRTTVPTAGQLGPAAPAPTAAAAEAPINYMAGGAAAEETPGTGAPTAADIPKGPADLVPNTGASAGIPPEVPPEAATEGVESSARVAEALATLRKRNAAAQAPADAAQAPNAAQPPTGSA